MVEPKERFPSHVSVTDVRSRQLDDGRVQIIERVMVQPTDAYEQPAYRVLEVRNDGLQIVGVYTFLRDARKVCDKRAAR